MALSSRSFFLLLGCESTTVSRRKKYNFSIFWTLLSPFFVCGDFLQFVDTTTVQCYCYWDYWSQDKIGAFHVCTLKWPKHNWWTDSHFKRCAIKGSFIGPTRRIRRHSEQLSYTSQTGILLCLVSEPSFIEIEIFIDFYYIL